MWNLFIVLWLNTEVLASIKELFSCHKDDGSAYNDQADALQENICRPHWTAAGGDLCRFIFSLPFLSAYLSNLYFSAFFFLC